MVMKTCKMNGIDLVLLDVCSFGATGCLFICGRVHSNGYNLVYILETTSNSSGIITLICKHLKQLDI